MMTAEQLKNSILKMAMQGKLVEQRSKEGTGEELYEEILNERQRLVKEGKIKKERVQTEKTEEPPFDIPESWKWAKLNDIVAKTIKRGKSPKYTQKSDILVFAQKCNTKAGIIDLSLCLFLDDNQLSKYPEEEFMVNNDIVINSTGNGTLGRVNIFRDSDNPQKMPIVPDSHVTVIRCNKQMEVKYVFYCLKYYQPYMEKLGSGSTNQTELGAGILKELAFPIPPLEEQKRIVAKIEVLMPFVEQYAAASTKLNTLNAAFPEMMKKSILLEAVQGKLVPQDPNDEPASLLLKKIAEEKKRLFREGKIKKQKPMPEITEDEIPFDIPENWEWVRFGSVMNVVSARRVHQSDWKNSGIPFYRAREIAKLAETDQVENELFISEELYNEFSKSGVPKPGDLMVTGVGTLGKTYVVKEGDKFYYKDASVLCFENFAKLDPYFIKRIMESPLMRGQIKSNSSGTTVATLTMVRMVEYLIPIPPLAEQKRIADRIEELLPFVNVLKQ